MKKIVSLLAAGATLLATTTASYAHTGDIFGGGYINYSSDNMKFRVQSSVYSKLPASVYTVPNAWSGISSNVGAAMVKDNPGISSSSDFIIVYDDPDLGGFLGTIHTFDSNGADCNEDVDWAKITVALNVDKLKEKDKVFAGAVVTHEVGHALKLKHPARNSNLPGHNLGDGYPRAIMYGDVNDIGVFALRVEKHDRECLIAKWGA